MLPGAFLSLGAATTLEGVLDRGGRMGMLFCSRSRFALSPEDDTL